MLYLTGKSASLHVTYGIAYVVKLMRGFTNEAAICIITNRIAIMVVYVKRRSDEITFGIVAILIAIIGE